MHRPYIKTYSYYRIGPFSIGVLALVRLITSRNLGNGDVVFFIFMITGICLLFMCDILIRYLDNIEYICMDNVRLLDKLVVCHKDDEEKIFNLDDVDLYKFILDTNINKTTNEVAQK